MSHPVIPKPHAPTPSPKAKPVRGSGEAMVWFAGMGLALGLAMVVALLAVILVNGLKVFWPRPVVQIELKEGSDAALGDSSVLAGELVKKQEKIVRLLDEASNPLGDGPEMEWQLFVGNKDVYGLSYRWLDAGAITGTTRPEDIMAIERLEYGDALAYPISLSIEGQAPLVADSEEFSRELRRRVAEANERRREIRRIEKDQIGDISSRMEKLRLEEKSLELKFGEGNVPPERLAEISEQQAELQAQYETLAAQALTLRERQNEDSLTYRLPTGEERTLPLGDVVRFYFPNQLNFFERVGFFFAHAWEFLSEEPREANTEGGVFPAIFGTCVMTVLMSIAVMPFGVLAAIYLREYAKQGFLVRSVRIAVNNLAGVPSIVFGVFGLGFFVYFVGGSIDRLFYPASLPTPTYGTGGILWAALTLALMTVPVVIVATEEALAAVPRGMREGAFACGASKWQMIQRIVLPASVPGMITGLVLAMARGAGEVAPLMLVGVVKLAPSLPLDMTAPFFHFDRKFMHLGFHIYDLGFQSPDSEAAKPMVFATTLLLIVLVVLLNLGAIIIREKVRRKYATGAF